jgi:predicted nucleic acid-binding protein
MDLYRHIQLSPAIRVVPASRALLEEGISLYSSRPDKDWSLTDCISFVVMRDEGIIQALTGDHHFEQAGFKALLH